jgi:hypothetical protein
MKLEDSSLTVISGQIPSHPVPTVAFYTVGERTVFPVSWPRVRKERHQGSVVAQQMKSKMTTWQAKIALMRAKMEVAMTVVLLAASLYVILVGHANPNQQWAVRVVGVVCGSWFRPRTLTRRA